MKVETTLESMIATGTVLFLSGALYGWIRHEEYDRDKQYKIWLRQHTTQSYQRA